MKNKFVLALFVLLAIAGIRYWNVILDETLLLFMGDSTVYADEFSEVAFDQIEVGQSLQEVTESLGAPFEQYENTNPDGKLETAFVYSMSSSDSHYRKRILFFVDGAVSAKVEEVHID